MTEVDPLSGQFNRLSEDIRRTPVEQLVSKAASGLYRAVKQARLVAANELAKDGAAEVSERRISEIGEAAWQSLTDAGPSYAAMMLTACHREVERRWGKAAATTLASLKLDFSRVCDAALALSSQPDANRINDVELVAGRDDDLDKGMYASLVRLGRELSSRPDR